MKKTPKIESFMVGKGKKRGTIKNQGELKKMSVQLSEFELNDSISFIFVNIFCGDDTILIKP